MYISQYIKIQQLSKMDINLQPQLDELKNLIQFAFAQRKYQKVVELATQYITKSKQQKQIYQILIMRSKAYSQTNKLQQSLTDIDTAIQKGELTFEINIFKIRLLIQLGQIQMAEKQTNELLQSNEEIRKIFKLKNAITILKDQFQSFKLSQVQEQILTKMNIWLKNKGAKYDKLKLVKLHPGYRGAIATKHIKKKQPIVVIPRSQLITLEMAKANKYSQAVIQNRIRLQSPKHTFLSILLLQLKNTPDSKFKPYIDLLPSDHSCFPVNYTKSELQMLQGSPFLNMIFEKVIDLKKDYDAVSKCDVNFNKNYTFKQFCWARMMIGSRIFGLLISGVKTQVLVPFADMLNHRQPKQTVWNYQQSVNGFVIESLQDIQVGEEVFDSYGRKCNTRFLLNYGFVLEQNPDNQIAIKIYINDDDSFGKQKKLMIGEQKTQIYTQIKKINLNMNNNKFYQLMGCLRFICVNQLDVINMLKKISNIQVTKQPYVMMRTPPISVKNQILVWKKLLSTLKQQIGKYPTTLQSDILMLKQRKLSYNERNILILRSGEKKIIHQYIEICESVLGILDSQQIIAKLQSKVNQIYSRYLYKILCLTPGINKKNLEKKLAHYFQTQSEDNLIQETQQVAEN